MVLVRLAESLETLGAVRVARICPDLLDTLRGKHSLHRDPDLFEGLIDTVNARHLHKALGSKKAFSDWVKNRIASCNFKENGDFVVFHQTVRNPLGGRPGFEYFLTLDAA